MEATLLLYFVFLLLRTANARYSDYVINVSGNTLHYVITHPLFQETVNIKHPK